MTESTPPSTPLSRRPEAPAQPPTPQGSRRQRKPKEELPPAIGLPALLQLINGQDYDILLVGDGSGSGWVDPCGWSCVMVERQDDVRQLFYGGISAGSINLAEILPYLHALTYYHEHHGRQIRPRRVHIITDSDYVAEAGNQAANTQQPLPRTHQGCWAMLREFSRLGYLISFHWRRRSQDLFNVTCDLIASQTRAAVKNCRERQLQPADLQLVHALQEYLATNCPPDNEVLTAVKNLLPKLLSGLTLADSAASLIRENLQQRTVPQIPLQALHPLQ